jgi:hypothetical protein
MRDLIEATLIDGIKKKNPPAKHILSKGRRDKIIGNYHSITSRFGRSQKSVLIVKLEDGLLYTVYKKRQRGLIPVNDLHFRRRGEPTATIGVIDKDGETYLQGDVGNFMKSGS